MWACNTLSCRFIVSRYICILSTGSRPLVEGGTRWRGSLWRIKGGAGALARIQKCWATVLFRKISEKESPSRLIIKNLKHRLQCPFSGRLCRGVYIICAVPGEIFSPDVFCWMQKNSGRHIGYSLNGGRAKKVHFLHSVYLLDPDPHSDKTAGFGSKKN